MKTHFEIDYSTSIAKRIFDIGFSCVALLLCLAIVPFIALAIKLDSAGPVLYKQLRVGRILPDYIVLFEMLKFRTMIIDAERDTGATWAKEKDPRITTVGRLLRKTRLDELPQFINVIKGEMSLIGPRPERPDFYQKLETAIPFFTERTYGVTPGITGLAQVNQGYDTSIEDVRSKVCYDHCYSLALSTPLSWLRMDISILLRTIIVVIMGRGH